MLTTPRRAVLLRLAMAHEGKGEIEKAKSLLDEVLQIDARLGISDDEDQEHRQRLDAASEPLEARPAVASRVAARSL